MRFLLDNDVDVAVGRVLRRADHECWTASDAGLAGPDSAPDDALSIYAQAKDAVVVTHDAEFSRRRMAMTYGRHVWLRCEQPDAASLVRKCLDDLVAALEEADDLVVTVGPSGVTVQHARWR